MKDKAKHDFSSRMHEACTDLRWPEKSRHIRLHGLLKPYFDIVPKTVEKWFLEKGFPQFDKIGIIADKLEVDVTWLMTGKGEKHLNREHTTSPSLSIPAQLIVNEVQRYNEEITLSMANEIVSQIGYQISKIERSRAEDELVKTGLERLINDSSLNQRKQQ